MTPHRHHDAEARGRVRRFLAALPDAQALRAAIDADCALTNLMGDVFYKRGAGRERALKKLRRNRHGLRFTVCGEVTGGIALARAPWSIRAIDGRAGVEAFEQACVVTVSAITTAEGMLRGAGALVLSAHALLRAVQRGRYTDASLPGAVMALHDTLAVLDAEGVASLPIRRGARLLPDARGAWVVEALTASTKVDAGAGMETARAIKCPVRTFYGIPELKAEEETRLAPWRSDALVPKALGFGLVHGAAIKLGATRVPSKQTAAREGVRT